MLLKLGNLICIYAGFAKFIYKISDICSQQKKKRTEKEKKITYMDTKIHTYMIRKIRIS